MTYKRSLNLFLALGVCAFLLFLNSGCGVIRRCNLPSMDPHSGVKSKNTGISQYRPKSFLVYPFRNTTFNPQAGALARRAFQAQAAVLGEVKSLRAVDQAAGRTWSVQDALRVGEQLGVDAVIIGEAQNCESTWLLFFAGNYVSASIQVFDVKRRACIYTGSTWDCDVAFSPIIVPAIIDNISRERYYFKGYNCIASDIINNIDPSVYKSQQ